MFFTKFMQPARGGECTAVSKKHSWTSGRMVVKKQKTDKTPSIVEKYDGFNEAVKWTG